MHDDLTNYSSTRLAGMIRRRAASPVEVVEAYLRRIERVNPRLNAVVALCPDALDQARAAEAVVMRGDELGALCGVPLTVKDTIDVRGLTATAGSKARAQNIASADAGAVARLRAAGAIILGKTNSAELALDYTSENLVYGRTNNPHDAARAPGGSSGGCAAAVCARLTAGSLGSDLVGSIRIPACLCGVAGLKPTAGRAPASGHCPPIAGPFALAASLGPIARRVEDVELLYEALIGTGARRVAGKERRVSDFDGLRGARCAWYADDGNAPVTAETRAAVRRAAEALRDAGCEVFEERPPGVERGPELWLALFSHSARKFVQGIYEGRESDAGAAARVMLERAAIAETPSLDEYLAVWALRDRLRHELLAWMEATPLIIAPVGSGPAFAHGARKLNVDGAEVGVFRAFGYAQTFNVFDLPVACVPAGKSREGLPIGVQIIARPFAEREALLAARCVEQASGGWQAPPENL